MWDRGLTATCLSLILAASVVGGCATGSQKMDYSARMQGDGPAACLALTEEDIDTNYAGTVTAGAVIGGVAGTLLGVLAGAAAAAGGQDPTALVIGGAAAGFALGASLGAIDGVETADKKEVYALQEAQLDCQIEAMTDDNAQISTVVFALRTSVQATEDRLKELENDYAAKRVSKDAAMKTLAEVDDSSQQMQRTVAAMKTKRDQYVAARTKTQIAAEDHLDTQELDRQIDTCNRQIAESERILGHLLDRRKVAAFF